MFHRFEPNPRSKTTIAPAEFRRVLSALRDANYCPISLTDYLSDSFDPACAGRKLFAITFDDGHPSQFNLLPDGSIDPNSGLGVLESIFPNLKATFFLNVSNGGKPFGRDSARKLEMLRALKLEIGNHTVSHPYLNRIGPARVAAEVGGACRSFGMTQMMLAYPYGIPPRAPITRYKTGCAITAAFNAWLGYFEGIPRGQSARTGPFLAPLPTSASFEKRLYGIPRLNIHSLADLRRDVLENPGVYTLPEYPDAIARNH
jgi:Polysaccharide deacetylase